ncbi:MAG: cation:proton antiporter [Bacteroidaceae bacterium]|nr:cation:proton antiporter [Bacteroidaceae bacterium]
MILLNISFQLPITHPTWIFFIMLSIILFAPLLLQKLRIPHIIGMILAGILIGKYGFNILERDSSFELFGKVGILYIMFLAGLEMDIRGFMQNKKQGLIFGLLTFTIPFVVGYYSSVYLLGYGLLASVLLACIIADHTPVTYPIVSNMGLGKHSSVSISIGGTMVAVVLSLFILATISGHYNEERGASFWLLFLLKCIAYCVGTIYIYPRITRYFFKKYSDSIMQYIFILSLLFLSAALAELIGLEDILGAFIAGVVLNRLIPHVSPLMNRIEFVGNALFIPYFLVGVGMLINIKTLFEGGDTLFVVFVILAVATSTKWIAAFLTQKIFHMNSSERQIMFGLSNAHAAGALAMVMIGTKTLIAENTYMMNNDELNGIVIMILGSCLISSIATEMAAKKLTLAEKEVSNKKVDKEKEKILLSLSNPETVEELVTTAVMMRSTKQNHPLIGVHVMFDSTDEKVQFAEDKEILELAMKHAAAADVKLYAQNRVSTNIAVSIVHTLKENDCSEIIIGLHKKSSFTDSNLGAITLDLLKNTHKQVILLKAQIPMNTLRRIVVLVPPRAEYESGFHKWIDRIARIDEQLGCRILFHADPNTIPYIQQYTQHYYTKMRTTFLPFEKEANIIDLAKTINDDHLFVVIQGRPGSISYEWSIDKTATALRKHFTHCGIMLIFPDQYGDPANLVSFTDPRLEADNAPRIHLRKWWRKNRKASNE